MGLSKMGTLSVEQRNLIALGWLCGTYHENTHHLATTTGGYTGLLLQTVVGTAMETPMDVYTDVREQVVIGFLDGDNFKADKNKHVKAMAFTKNLERMEAQEQRLAKIRKASEGEDELDVSAVAKRKLN